MSLEAGAAVVVLRSELSDAPGWIFATRGDDECGYVPRAHLLRDRSQSPSRRSWFGSRGSARGRSPKPKPKKKKGCLLYTSPSPRDQRGSRMPSSA